MFLLLWIFLKLHKNNSVNVRCTVKGLSLPLMFVTGEMFCWRAWGSRKKQIAWVSPSDIGKNMTTSIYCKSCLNSQDGPLSGHCTIRNAIGRLELELENFDSGLNNKNPSWVGLGSTKSWRDDMPVVWAAVGDLRYATECVRGARTIKRCSGRPPSPLTRADHMINKHTRPAASALL